MLCICICLVLVFVFSSYRHAAGAQHKGRLSSARYQPVPLPCLFCLSRGPSPQWQGNQHIAHPRGEILQNGRANCSPLEQIEVKIKRDFASCTSTTMANQILFIKSNWKRFFWIAEKLCEMYPKNSKIIVWRGRGLNANFGWRGYTQIQNGN